MPYFVEFVKYRINGIAEEEFFSLRSAAVTAVKAAHPALVDVPILARRPDGSWVDVWIYETKEAAEKANSTSGDVREFVAFASLLDGVEIESGTIPDGAVSPLGAA